jgi:hypothetical protein
MAFNRREEMNNSSGISLVALAILIGCGGDAEFERQEMTMGPDLVASPIRARGPAGPEPELEFHRALDLDLIGDSIVIVDNGNDRIVMLDAGLRYVWSSGREGEGPGEFEAPFAVRTSSVGLTAIDFGNTRFTTLDRSGALIGTASAPHVTSTFGVRSDGAIVMPARLESHYLYIVGQQDRPVSFVERDTTRAIADPFGDAGRPPLVAVTAGDTIHVFDETDFHLYKFDGGGQLRLRRGIPAGFRDSVYAKVEELVGALERGGYRVVGSTLAKTLKPAADGRLVLLVAAGTTVGFVIDPHTYEARRIVIPEDITEWAPLKNANSAVLSGDRLIALSQDSLFVYDLREAGS